MLHLPAEHSTHSKPLNFYERLEPFVRKVAHSYSEGPKFGSLVLDSYLVLLPQYRAYVHSLASRTHSSRTGE